MSYKRRIPPKTLHERHQRRVQTSSKLAVHACSNTVNKNRSCSTGTLPTNIVRPKKTTRSDCTVSDKVKTKIAPAKLNRGQASGDTGMQNTIQKKSNLFISSRTSGVQQYFRNKNFGQSSASVHGGESLKKVSNLITISEQSEENSHERSISGPFSSCNGGFDGETVLDITELKCNGGFDGKTALDIAELKKFRRENYFECHSAAAKLKGGSVISLKDHKCVYRFYLNERLFPVPVSADYNKVVRCTECHLPLEGAGQNPKDINGTIQAKVKLNGQLQDMTLMLPIQKSLVIKETRREEGKKEEQLYFGIVRLSRNGDSVFCRNTPGDSLALRYQKGYQELMNSKKYEYERVDNDEVIVI